MSLLATISALHATLDKTPDDHHARLLLGDALEEAGGEWAVRADGYRALGSIGRYAYCGNSESFAVANYRIDGEDHTDALGLPDRSDLPEDWFSAITTALPIGRVMDGKYGSWLCYASRREAEGDAAKAFAKLPAERQAELLSVPLLAGGE